MIIYSNQILEGFPVINIEQSLFSLNERARAQEVVATGETEILRNIQSLLILLLRRLQHPSRQRYR